MNRTKLLSIRGCCKEAEDDLCESLCELGFKRLALSADLNLSSIFQTAVGGMFLKTRVLILPLIAGFRGILKP